MIRHYRILFLLAAVLGIAASAQAEVYLAATEGYRCSQCHVNLTGGGMRSEFGSVWAQTHLPFWVPERKDDSGLGQLLRSGQAGPVRLGGNLRAVWNAVSGTDDRDDTNQFDVEEGTLFLEANLYDDRVTFYVDESFAPGGTRNREAFALLKFPLGQEREGQERDRWWIKAGSFFPPFGLRQLDDETYTRAGTGFSFTNNDDGVEVGFEPGNWQIALALTNGEQGAPEENDQKQVSLFTEHVWQKWRLGFSAMHNSGDLLDRSAFSVHGSVRLGKVVLIGEVDLIQDDLDESLGGDSIDQLAGFVETRVWIAKGQNLRLTWDLIDPDDDISTDTQERITLGYEGFLLPNMQLRANGTWRDAPRQYPELRDDSLSLELHVFF